MRSKKEYSLKLIKLIENNLVITRRKSYNGFEYEIMKVSEFKKINSKPLPTKWHWYLLSKTKNPIKNIKLFFNKQLRYFINNNNEIAVKLMEENIINN